MSMPGQMSQPPIQGNLHIVDNPRLEKRSDIFYDDTSSKEKPVIIEKRCFFLLCGDDDINGNWLEFESVVNVFKEPRSPYRIDVKFSLHNTIIEISNEVIHS